MPCLHAQLPPQCCYCDSYHGAWSPGPTTTSSSTTNRRPASLASRSRSSSSSSSSQHLVTHSGLVVRSVRGVKIAERTSRFWVKNPVFSLHFPCNTPCPTQPQLISFSLTPLTLFRWPHSPPPPPHTHIERTSRCKPLPNSYMNPIHESPNRLTSIISSIILQALVGFA